ncbi:MAG: thermonuclease family protein, partial [Candidatus Omnitrophica bacterium]|nr:thermonuclease family protein [Candidatus Omnitrophota bacterium]
MASIGNRRFFRTHPMRKTWRNTLLTLLTLVVAILVALFGDSPQPVTQAPTHTKDRLVGRVLTVADGDTLTLDSDGQRVKVRLQGIDCPERDQPFGNEAGGFVRDLVEGKRIEVISLGKDQYDRVLGEVFIDDRNLNQELLRNGFAWWYKKHAKDRNDYRDLQAEARENGRGLWS